MRAHLSVTKFTGYAVLAFFLPISYPFVLNGGFAIMFPSEIIIVLLSLVLGVRYLLFDPLDKRILFHPASILIAMDVLWQLITCFYSDMPEVAFKRTLVSFVYIFIYYLIAAHLFNNSKNILSANQWYILGLAVPITYTLYKHSHFNFTVTSSPHISRPFYNDHTIYGAVLVFFMPFIVYSVFKKQKNKQSTVLFTFLLILFSMAIFLSYSRAAWLSLVAMTTMFLILKMKYKFLILGSIVTLSFLSFILWGDYIYKLLQSNANSTSKREDLTEHIQSVTNVNTDVSNAERINRWKAALRMYDERPVVGFGPGTYQFYYGNFQEKKDMTRISTYRGDKGHAHSEYLNRLSETGWPGLLLFVCTFAMIFYTSWKTDRYGKSFEVKNISMVCSIALVGYCVHSFFNGFIETDKVAMPVYGAMAAIVAMSGVKEN